MLGKIITTNLRIPEKDLALAKSVARSRGISVNEYIKRVVKESSVRDQLVASKPAPKKDVYSFLLEFSKRKRVKGKKMDLSEEDKAIYDF